MPSGTRCRDPIRLWKDHAARYSATGNATHDKPGRCSTENKTRYRNSGARSA
ncbi:hypothetical protein ZHAS_00013133 [Anopheles sinensis]|uniref:Uncharacterized protein n=1 Tax=Anopheles sinensis TaxID=74873 RepID=A0A084W4N0_ANOSI|nr:hypothetical protein ZHAS_00013133 [Anopheles sinensis]